MVSGLVGKLAVLLTTWWVSGLLGWLPGSWPELLVCCQAGWSVVTLSEHQVGKAQTSGAFYVPLHPQVTASLIG